MLRRTLVSMAALCGLVFAGPSQAAPSVGQSAPDFALTETTHYDYLVPAKLGQWMVEQKASPTQTLMDAEGTVGQAYGARTTPHMYIVNPQGSLIYAGGIDSIPSSRPDDVKSAVNYVKQSVAQALAGQPLSNPVTRPYGCSVKYKSGA